MLYNGAQIIVVDISWGVRHVVIRERGRDVSITRCWPRHRDRKSFGIDRVSLMPGK